MKKLSVFLIVAIAFAFTARAETKIGVFDAQEVLDSIDEGKKAVAALKKEAEERKKQIETKGKELEKMNQELESQRLVLAKDALEKKQKEFQAKAIEFQKLQYEAQKDMQSRELSMTGDIFKKINAIMQKMGKEGGYDFILEKNQGAVTYFKSGDLTQQVITEYNKTYGAKK